MVFRKGVAMSFKKAVVSQPGKERVAKTPFGARIVIHATAAQTGGAFGSWETFTPPGQGPAPHMHTRETEVFRVIRGHYRFAAATTSSTRPSALWWFCHRMSGTAGATSVMSLDKCTPS